MIATASSNRIPFAETQESGENRVTASSPPAGGDAQLAAAVDQALRRTGFPYLRNLNVSVNQVAVTLRGRVPSFYVKQMAQEAARSVTTVRVIVNELDVVSPSRGRTP